MSSSSSFQRALTRNSSWPDKEELLDVVYWSRQFLAVFLGFVFGCCPLSGMLAVFLYCAMSTLLMNFYIGEFQNEDVEEYGGFIEIAKEGFMSSFASFLVIWIIVYSSLYGS